MEGCKGLKRQYYSGNKIPTQLMDLPMDMLVDIFLRLPVESIHCIRRVSKTLLNTVDSRSFVRQHTLSLIAVNNSHVVHRLPQLMCFAETTPPSPTLQSLRYDGSTTLTKGGYAFTDSKSSNYAYLIHCVFYNLFCMANYEDGHCLLINPLLRQVLSLPTDKIQQLTNYGPDIYDVATGLHGMGFDNITNTYKIVRVSGSVIMSNQNSYRTYIHVLGTNSWREIPSVPPRGLTCSRNLCAYGDMHWLLRRSPGGSGATKSHVISFDFKTEEFHWTPTPPTLRSSNKDSNLHLLSLRGSMAIVETYPSPEGGGMQVEIWVVKDYIKKEWAREYSINVDMQPEFGLEYATCGEWEHGIFFNDHGRFLQSDGATKLFLDLRTASVNLAICPIETKSFTNIMSYTGSLISLRDYGGIDYTDETPA